VADESDVIRIDLASDISEGERARKKLQEIEQQTKELKSSFEQGNLALARYNQELRNLASQADRARAALDKVDTGRLTGTKRASAKFQIGLAGANIAQDVIQGGPAAGVNNILGLAGNNSVRALGGEMLAAAGGVKVVAAAFGTVAASAGAAFLTIHTGLKDANLGWSDLGSVIDEMLGGAATKSGNVASKALGEVWQVVKDMTGGVSEYWLGWRTATEAVRAHKDEIDRNTASLNAYLKAKKDLAGIKSEDQQAREKAGKLVAKEVADLGGEGGIDAVLDKLAEQEAGPDADKVFTQKGWKKDKDGKDTDEPAWRQMTGRQLAKERLTTELGDVLKGDAPTIESFIGKLRAAGYDASGAVAGSAGVDRKAIAKEAQEKDAQEFKARSEELAKSLQERYTLGAAIGQTPGRARVVGALTKGGVSPEEAEKHADAVLGHLREGYSDAIGKRAAEKGLDPAGAARDLVREADDKKAKADKARADHDESERERARREAIEKAEKLTAGTGLGARTDDALLRAGLKSGGAPGVATKEITDQLKRELVGRGMGEEQAGLAAGAIAGKHAAKLNDDIMESAMNPKQKELAAPQHLANADFARSVESAGAKDSAKLLSNTEAMKEKLTELVRLGNRGARLQ